MCENNDHQYGQGLVGQIEYKYGEFKMTLQAPAYSWSLSLHMVVSVVAFFRFCDGRTDILSSENNDHQFGRGLVGQ